MILKWLKLKNIRSYIEEEIEFPEGAVLLAGDVGSGKSSILLSIEFALFGIMRSNFSGGALLRQGANEGIVELCFSLGEEEITIKRSLKRTAKGVAQGYGHVIRGGVCVEGTPVELKTQVLELLGYPKESVHKAKDDIFRYTVYTPQEHMKHILFSSAESRLDTLRKVFDMDKYKIIKENLGTYLRSVKQEQKIFEMQMSGLDEKREEMEKKNEELLDTKEVLGKVVLQLGGKRKEVEQALVIVKEGEEEHKKLVLAKEKLSGLDAELRGVFEQFSSEKKRGEELSVEIGRVKEELGEENFSEKISLITDSIKEVEERKKYLEEECAQKALFVREHEVKIGQQQEQFGKIHTLAECPVCLQEVKEGYKEKIALQQKEGKEEFSKAIAEGKEQQLALEGKKKELVERLEALRKEEKEIGVLVVKKKRLDDLQKECLRIEQEQVLRKKRIGEINQEKMQLQEVKELLEKKVEKHVKVKEEYEKLREELHGLELREVSLKKEEERIVEVYEILRKEIEQKVKAKENLGELQKLRGWFEEGFLPLTNLIEKQVMTKVYHEFNDMFVNWFGTIMEEESISARLDEQFTPIIQQDGYDIEIEQLSGGEKTSCALAYRLALNKVINEVVSGIKTKDLLILDEPTDGFSAAQLDRVRVVLDNLGVGQIIIVSHEAKIESFVDHIIRVHKEHHVSRVYV